VSPPLVRWILVRVLTRIPPPRFSPGPALPFSPCSTRFRAPLVPPSSAVVFSGPPSFFYSPDDQLRVPVVPFLPITSPPLSSFPPPPPTRFTPHRFPRGLTVLPFSTLFPAGKFVPPSDPCILTLSPLVVVLVLLISPFSIS